MDELLEAVERLRKATEGIESNLYDLAMGAEILGLDRMAGRLKSQAKLLRSVASEVYDASGKAVSESFRRAQESSANILRTAMAVSERAKLKETL